MSDQIAARRPAYAVHRNSAAHESLLGGAAGPWSAADRISWGSSGYSTEFRALWSERGLYARFDAVDDAPWHTMTRHDDALWEEEVVEIFIDPDGSGENYAELEISPMNVTCDLRMIRGEPDRAGDLSWNFAGLETAVVPLADARGKAMGWTALACMPWLDFTTLDPARRLRLPPGGERWRFNVYRIKRPGGPTRRNQAALMMAWSPTGQPSFHVPAAFGDLVFVTS